jgi:non-ribosomal peptide synthetase component E (peptide arylation enzyme)
MQIAGRRKEIINRGGKQYFPREVEELLQMHPKIMPAAMAGIADHRLGGRGIREARAGADVNRLQS